ncbi:hypothetical protein BJY01DRAFT_259278 [Aspergillus pseudoustus]|uniref:Cupin 2 conserved barrel domain-containing protein n=1 Tax=Aspergillus pseudoustus TaxID=1810923 RepID=A0ABR4J5R9_9EURO
MPDSPLPNPNRYITTNDANGVALFSTTTPESLSVSTTLGGSALARLAYTLSGGATVNLTSETDLKAYYASLSPSSNLPPLVRLDGLNVWYVDTPPDSESPLHRTVSLDFVIQVHGEQVLTLSNGESRIVKPGDITIQRSTMHKWHNPSKTEWSRMMAVMVACQPVVTENGDVLGEKFESGQA